MNIGIDINPLLSAERTGVGEYTFELLNALFEIDKKNHYFLFSNAWDKEDHVFWEQKNVHCVPTHYPNKFFHLALCLFRRPFLDTFVVKNYEKKQKMNIGHLNIFFSPNLGFTSISKSCKHIQVVHDLSFEIFPQFFSFKRRWWHTILRPRSLCHNAAVVITPSLSSKRDVSDIYDIIPEKIHVISPGVSSVFLTPPLSSEDHVRLIKEKYHLPEKYIFFLGTLEPRKNIGEVIEAYKQSSLLSKGYHLVIAGSKGWDYKSIVKKIEETAGVTYIGYVHAEDKPLLYSFASLFVYPSYYEGFGIPVAEAMSCGVPVLTSNRSSLPEITQGAAYLVDPHNVEEIKVGMERILSSESLQKSLKEKGKQEAERFQWKKSAEDFLNLLIETV